MTRDKGVRGNYIEQAFKADDMSANLRRRWMPRWKKYQYYDSKRAAEEAEKRTVLSEFEMMQESRPLKPRSQKR